MKIFAHKDYSVAAAELQKFYETITEKKAELTPLFPKEGDVVCLCPAGDALADDRVKDGSDAFSLVSKKEGDRTVLVITAGRVRSSLYGVYAFLEEAAGCHYFWDGDVIPKADTIPLEGLDRYEAPRFEYRAIRYFAHRGLHRFQAEHWGPEDWKREIDWMLKKRLNLFMLRIGTDDLFQRAFPEIVPYPSNEKPIPELLGGFDNRTTFWSLEYRGALRKQILDYAFARDLLHPEDCGTMTHWYSRTPQAFLDKVKPTLMTQESKGYSEQTGLAWDIFDETNLKNYQHLTNTHVREFGRPEIFHTIGLAERSLKGDREKGFAVKKYAYDTVTDFVKKTYPKSPLFIAAWDFFFCYQPEEVRRMVGTFDPETHVILDYTVDLKNTENDFEQWNVVGKFPYIFGIFHGYQPQSHVHGDYPYLDKKLKIADADPFCKGMAFWPELSHSDSMMLEYFTDAAWRPDYLPPEQKIDRFCHKRYGKEETAMKTIWHSFAPLYEVTADQGYYMSSFFDLYDDPRIAKRLVNLAHPKHAASLELAKKKIRLAEAHLSDMKETLEAMANLTQTQLENEFIARDSVDLLRSITERVVDVMVLRAILAWLDGEDADALSARGKACLEALELFAKVLATREEFSAVCTCETLETVSPVNPHFYRAIKDNVVNSYCRSSVYEAVRYVYLPEMKLFFDTLASRTPADSFEIPEGKDEIFRTFMDTPLESMKPQKEDFTAVCQEILRTLF